MQKQTTMPSTLPTINSVVGAAAVKAASHRRGGIMNRVELHTVEEDDGHGSKYAAVGAAETSFVCGEGDISFSTDDGDDAEASFQEGDVSVEAEDPTEPAYEEPHADTEEEEDDDFEHVESSPCVTAGITANKKKNELFRGMVGKTFKPLNFGKRGMERAATFTN
jgi:Tfp pilus assembly protein FimV